ncbi:hypothetical protein [endosymbiont GvMRE of Glomus versiforme]|uniref:hypothetical protein n=1 Tax=endosymbiont GvMRE of Glomus versiforme TaxID=2039283 RepID=UPI000EE1EF7D|nr:hypothetical protein [endosymbiont GvMRE of Glomus versiforme]RHZ35364.1 hypothetical protein GvMRE_IIg433 [endosymbiont GvMRE of Glomus versiforme]
MKVNLNFQVNSFLERHDCWDISLKIGSGGSESSAGGVVFKKTDGTDFLGGKKYNTLLLPINFISGGTLKENQGDPKREQIKFEIEEYLLEDAAREGTLRVKPAQKVETEISFILLKVREDKQKKVLLLEIEKQGEKTFTKYLQQKVNYIILEKEVVEVWERKGGVPLLSQRSADANGKTVEPGKFSALNWGKKFTFTQFDWNDKVSPKLVGGGFNKKERVKFYEGFKAIEKEATGKKVFWNEWVIEKFAGDEAVKDRSPISSKEPILKIILEDTFRGINIEKEENEWTAELKELEKIKNEINDKRLTTSNNLAEINGYIEKLEAYKNKNNKIKNWAWDIWDYNIHHKVEISTNLSALKRQKKRIENKEEELFYIRTPKKNINFKFKIIQNNSNDLNYIFDVEPFNYQEDSGIALIGQVIMGKYAGCEKENDLKNLAPGTEISLQADYIEKVIGRPVDGYTIEVGHEWEVEGVKHHGLVLSSQSDWTITALTTAKLTPSPAEININEEVKKIVELQNKLSKVFPDFKEKELWGKYLINLINEKDEYDNEINSWLENDQRAVSYLKQLADNGYLPTDKLEFHQALSQGGQAKIDYVPGKKVKNITFSVWEWKKRNADMFFDCNFNDLKDTFYLKAKSNQPAQERQERKIKELINQAVGEGNFQFETDTWKSINKFVRNSSDYEKLRKFLEAIKKINDTEKFCLAPNISPKITQEEREKIFYHPDLFNQPGTGEGFIYSRILADISGIFADFTNREKLTGLENFIDGGKNLLKDVAGKVKWLLVYCNHNIVVANLKEATNLQNTHEFYAKAEQELETNPYSKWVLKNIHGDNWRAIFNEKCQELKTANEKPATAVNKQIDLSNQETSVLLTNLKKLNIKLIEKELKALDKSKDLSNLITKLAPENQNFVNEINLAGEQDQIETIKNRVSTDIAKVKATIAKEKKNLLKNNNAERNILSSRNTFLEIDPFTNAQWSHPTRNDLRGKTALTVNEINVINDTTLNTTNSIKESAVLLSLLRTIIRNETRNGGWVPLTNLNTPAAVNRVINNFRLDNFKKIESFWEEYKNDVNSDKGKAWIVINNNLNNVAINIFNRFGDLYVANESLIQSNVLNKKAKNCNICSQKIQTQLDKNKDWEVKRKEYWQQKLEKKCVCDSPVRKDNYYNVHAYSSEANQEKKSTSLHKCKKCCKVIKTVSSNVYGDELVETNKSCICKTAKINRENILSYFKQHNIQYIKLFKDNKIIIKSKEKEEEEEEINTEKLKQIKSYIEEQNKNSLFLADLEQNNHPNPLSKKSLYTGLTIVAIFVVGVIAYLLVKDRRKK